MACQKFGGTFKKNWPVLYSSKIGAPISAVRKFYGFYIKLTLSVLEV